MAASAAARLATLRLMGPDRVGIVAASTELLNRHNCGIVQSEHFADRSSGQFFQRIQFDAQHCQSKLSAASDLDVILKQLDLKGEIDWKDKCKRVAVMVSRYDHCLWELLLRHKAKELDCDLAVVISNHPDLQPVADTFGIPFIVTPITADTKDHQEQRQLELLEEHKVDLIVLARYMQVLSGGFLATYQSKSLSSQHAAMNPSEL